MVSAVLFLLIILLFNKEKVKSNSGWGPWSKWQCTATCGGGAGRKTRQCINPGPNRCIGGKYKYGKCNEEPCPTAPKPFSNKGWTPWMPWECSATCGGGKGTRYRICEDPDVCEGPEEETGPCAEQPCPIDQDSVNDDLQRIIEQQMATSRHNFVVQQGENILIPCKDKMAPVLDRENPNAEVQWYHNGQLSGQDGKRIIVEKSGDLRVKTSAEDNGLWWCSVAFSSKVSMTVSFAAVGVQNQNPDVILEKGEKLEMKCMATLLSRLVKSGIDQKWIHNSSTFRELKDVKSEKTDVLKIHSANYSDSGIWNCRYSDNFSSREWVTSVYRILVVPPRTLLQRLVPAILSIAVSLIIAGVAVRFYWKRTKMKLKEPEDEEDRYTYDDEVEDEPTPLFADQLKGFKNRRSS